MRVRHKRSQSIFRAELSTNTAYHRLAGIVGQPMLMVYRDDLGDEPILTWPALAEEIYEIVRAAPEDVEHLLSAGYKLPVRR
jgi:hypothetical protein